MPATTDTTSRTGHLLAPMKMTMTRTTVKIAVAAVGATLVSMLFVGSTVGALHQPAPPRLPSGDENGTAALFMFIGLALPSAAFGIVLGSVLGQRLNWLAKLVSLAGFAILAGLAASWIADGMTGALPGNPAGLIGIVALIGFAVSAACAAASRLAGPPLAVALLLVFVPAGIRAAGRPLAGPLLVLCLWAGISAIALALPRPRLPRRLAAHGYPAGSVTDLAAIRSTAVARTSQPAFDRFDLTEAQ
jgi:hypothetical protein